MLLPSASLVSLPRSRARPVQWVVNLTSGRRLREECGEAMGAEPCWRSRVTNPRIASDLIGHLARPGIDGRSRAGRKHDIHRIFAGRSRRDAAGDGKAQRTRGHRAHAVVRLVLYIMCVFSGASGEPASVLRASAPPGPASAGRRLLAPGLLARRPLRPTPCAPLPRASHQFRHMAGLTSHSR